MRYRSLDHIQPWKVVLPASHRIPRVLWYSGACSAPSPFGYRPLTFSGSAFHRSSPGIASRCCRSATPPDRSQTVWALPRSLAATYGIVFTFFSSGYLDVSVPRVPSSQTMDSFAGDGALPPPGFPIQVSVDQCLLAAPHSFSQLTTSFVGDWRQGIHPVLLLA